MRRKPYSVVLLDEIEKAHPDVFHILLQVLEDGRLTDSHGRTVSFKNTIVIMTSNIGSTVLLEGQNQDGEIHEKARREVGEMLRRQFRPEFLNRLDEVVLFTPLSLKETEQIVKLLTGELGERMGARGIGLDVSDAAEQYIAKEGYDPVYGARPLKRFIQSELETPIAKGLISGSITDGSTVRVDLKDNRLIIDEMAS